MIWNGEIGILYGMRRRTKRETSAGRRRSLGLAGHGKSGWEGQCGAKKEGGC